MSMNKDLVAQAVAAIPLWIAFLDEKEAEQDTLLTQMQSKSLDKPASFADEAASFSKQNEDDASIPSAASEPIPLSLDKSSIDDTDPNNDTRWAPTEEPIKEEPAEEELTEEEKEANQLQGFFRG